MYETQFGSLEKFSKGTIELIQGNAKHYVFSNLFEVASRSKPYEKVVVARNLQFVIETLRAEGTSPWFTASHDEFAVVMDGEVEAHLVKLTQPEKFASASQDGSIQLKEPPDGRKMGFVRLRRGHQVLLPQGAAYQFRAVRTGVLLLQTVLGKHSVEKWSDICYS